MFKHKNTTLFLFIIATLSSTIQSFHLKDVNNNTQNNFIFKYLLSGNKYDAYPGVLKKTFKTLFNMDMIVQDDIPKMLEFLATADRDSFNTRFAQDEQLQNETLVNDLLLILLGEDEQLKKVFSNGT